MQKPSNSGKNRRDHYAEATQRILSEMEKGVLPWRQPWDLGNAFDGAPTLPQNAISGRRYTGINRLLLMMSPHALATSDQRWCTYKQAQERGWQVRGGSKGTPVYFFKKIVVSARSGNEDDPDVSDGRSQALAELGGGADETGARLKTIPILRSYTVFHASQMDGIPPLAPREIQWTPEDRAEQIMQASGARVVHGGGRAFYRVTDDFIGMPPREAFKTATDYYATGLHELGHWTGHPSRLARPLLNAFGTPDYAKEELRAELISVFLGMETGIEPDLREAAAYLQSWIKVLQEDKKEVFRAAADAQRATEYVLALAGLHNDLELDGQEIGLDSEDEIDASAIEFPSEPVERAARRRFAP